MWEEESMYTNYVKSTIISGVKDQHNIMVFVGNGFDIAVLKKYRKDGLIPSYSKFYDYLRYKGVLSNNILYERMTSDREAGLENWSDFEETLGKLVQDKTPSVELNKALKEVQEYFLLFLNEIVEPEILLNVNEAAEKNKWATRALSNFLSDLQECDYKHIKFPSLTNHYHMFNYLFVNFNYTSLLDNYLHLDKEQFEPHPYRTVDTNFSFYPNPKNYDGHRCDDRTVWSTFIMTNIIHPHGYQNIPRSLLFGIEEKEYQSDKEYNKFNKSYWAQSNQKYSGYFEEVDLFIIYGTSLGKTDSWWWEKILSSLLHKDSELIIYYYNNPQCDEETVKTKFIDACKRADLDEETIENVKKKIFVVLYTDSDENVLFGMNSGEQIWCM